MGHAPDAALGGGGGGGGGGQNAGEQDGSIGRRARSRGALPVGALPGDRGQCPEPGPIDQTRRALSGGASAPGMHSPGVRYFTTVSWYHAV